MSQTTNERMRAIDDIKVRRRKTHLDIANGERNSIDDIRTTTHDSRLL